jgi:hypothetical protein
MGIATHDPGLNFALKGPLVGDAPVETLAGQSGELERHVGATSFGNAQVDGKCIPNQAIVSDMTWPNAGSA